MWLDTLNHMKKNSGLTLKQIADKSGVPIGTVNKLFAGQTADPKLDTMRAIVHCLGYSLDDLMPVGEPKQKSAPSVSDEALSVAAMYDAAPSDIRSAVKAILDRFKPVETQPYKVEVLLRKNESGENEVKLRTKMPNGRIIAMADLRPKPKKKTKSIPLFGVRFAAGSPEVPGDMDSETIETENLNADFAIHVNGDSMEPLLENGSIALGVQRMPDDGEVGAFYLDGGYVVKQFCSDSQGNMYLFSVNRARDDIEIYHDTDRELICFGTILCDRVPLPDTINV